MSSVVGKKRKGDDVAGEDEEGVKRSADDGAKDPNAAAPAGTTVAPSPPGTSSRKRAAGEAGGEEGGAAGGGGDDQQGSAKMKKTGDGKESERRRSKKKEEAHDDDDVPLSKLKDPAASPSKKDREGKEKKRKDGGESGEKGKSEKSEKDKEKDKLKKEEKKKRKEAEKSEEAAHAAAAAAAAAALATAMPLNSNNNNNLGNNNLNMMGGNLNNNNNPNVQINHHMMPTMQHGVIPGNFLNPVNVIVGGLGGEDNHGLGGDMMLPGVIPAPALAGNEDDIPLSKLKKMKEGGDMMLLGGDEDDQPLSKLAKLATTHPSGGGKKEKDGTKKEKVIVPDIPEHIHRWWEDKKDPDGPVWKSLHHNGVIFPPPYVPHSVPIMYEGKMIKLPPDCEEVATWYAVMRDTNYYTNETFQKNFFHDWTELLKKHGLHETIKSLAKCDFTPIWEWHLKEKEARNARSSEEKKKEKDDRMALEEKYRFCTLDGRKETVGNFKVEPPGLFRGRGEHPKQGCVKKRIEAEDVTLNMSKDAVIPKPPPGHAWADVIHNDSVTWLAAWRENIQDHPKYVFLHSSASIKQQSDLDKFEKARELKGYIETIRTDYDAKMKKGTRQERQLATALYLIDKLALRVGNEKEEDEADTVGCCSLRVEHMMLKDPSTVEFDFLGKDSMRYHNEVIVPPHVFANLKDFCTYKGSIDDMSNTNNNNNTSNANNPLNISGLLSPNAAGSNNNNATNANPTSPLVAALQGGKKRDRKNPDEDVFDEINPAILNAFLKRLMPGLTAKVFRTYNASITLDRQLKLNPPATTDSVDDKNLFYQRANREVAILCNHQRSLPKTFQVQMEKANDQISSLEEQVKVLHKIKEALENKKNSGIVPDELAQLYIRLSTPKKKSQKEKAKEENAAAVAAVAVAIGNDPLAAAAAAQAGTVPIDLNGGGAMMNQPPSIPMPMNSPNTLNNLSMNNNNNLNNINITPATKKKKKKSNNNGGMEEEEEEEDEERLETRVKKITFTLPSVESKIEKTEEKIKAYKTRLQVKDDTATVALSTSKVNYLDPRITVAFCKRHDFPVNKVFNKGLMEKFPWAFAVEPDWEF